MRLRSWAVAAWGGEGPKPVAKEEEGLGRAPHFVRNSATASRQHWLTAARASHNDRRSSVSAALLLLAAIIGDAPPALSCACARPLCGCAARP